MPDFLELKSRADLDQLVSEGLEESLTLDYKASPALVRDDKCVAELCKDVSAMANSAGGQIIYGITEDRQKGTPSGVDGGIDDPKITREWIEQVLNSRVQPRIGGVRIERIPVAEEKYAFVISVPQSQSGPHQAPDKRYYRRFELQSVPMEDYEVRDVMGRASKPDLKLSFCFDNMLDHARLKPDRHSEDNHPVGLTPIIENLSNEPALYAVVTIGITEKLLVLAEEYEKAGLMRLNGVNLKAFRVRFNSAQRLPIFKESPTALPNLGIVVSDRMSYDTNPQMIAYEIRAPGCFRAAKGSFFVEGGSLIRLKMDEPSTTPVTDNPIPRNL